ncbi:lysophospholipid acyltransferase family protein [Roseibium sp. RKSG952]|uniref:lysophospholipid acyltransferase family protein n=1 Tax=Roseibium sp. RKSG952 TaxID=2529384 RepID=UPI0012BD7F76|nr:lauroyl acyltransferase [Roseibium sp. RKSG952]MTH97151.1 lauroyl acyltransferase [Roseibium sp. RKSG952]
MQKTSVLKALQYNLEAAALHAAVFVFRLIPVDAASAIMGFLWKTFARFNSRHKRALRNIERVMPDTSPEERERIVLGMWDNLGRVAAETFFIDRLLRQNERFDPVADEISQKVLDEKKPCVFVSLHSGNWELVVQPAVRVGVEITGVYQALKNPSADELLRSMRKDLYHGGLFSKGHDTARKLISALKRGTTVAMMGDLREKRGVTVPFFGQPAYATPVPASLARNGRLPIIMGRTIRKNGVHFRVEARAIEVPVTDDRKADIQAATEEIHRVFEEWIREHPEQWMWIHRKWAQKKKR